MDGKVDTLPFDKDNFEAKNDIENSIGFLTIPSIIVAEDGRVISFNDGASLYFGNKITHGELIDIYITANVWKSIKTDTIGIGAVEDKVAGAFYYFRNMGEFYIIVIEHIASMNRTGDKLLPETRYIAYLAHHINNPLTVVKNTHELIKYAKELLHPHLSKCVELVDEKDVSANLKNILTMLEENIADQGESIRQLEQNMRYLRNLGALPIISKAKNLKSIVLRDLLKYVFTQLDYNFKHIQFNEQVHDNLNETMLRIDPEDFLNLFYVIYENALYAIRRTNVERGVINLKIDLEDEYMVITVENNGNTMSEKELAHGFDPFYSTKSSEEGLGLGLTNALAIINSYGGRIYLKNKDDGENGVVYTLTFPKNRVVI